MSEAIRVTDRYLHLESGALADRFDEFGDEVHLGHVLLVEAKYGGSQFMEGTLALSVLVGRLILGQNLSPIRVQFQHPAPRSHRQHHDRFRCPIEFGADSNALVVSKADLSRETGAGNAHMLAYLERHLETSSSQWPEDLEHQVERIISTSLASGEAGLEQVAAAWGLNCRTLQRRLAALGLGYSRMVERVRKRIFQDYMNSNPAPNLSELAFRLGYGDTAVVSRFLSTKLGRDSTVDEGACAKPSRLNDWRRVATRHGRCPLVAFPALALSPRAGTNRNLTVRGGQRPIARQVDLQPFTVSPGRTLRS